MIPCLLHAYWALHAVHFILGVLVIRSWQDRAHRPTFMFARSLAPWACLALVFWIPGAYLEFPADPWQHWARAVEWAGLEAVSEHSTWRKSSYFLAYSLVGWTSSPLLQLRLLDLYHVCCSLVLC